MKKIFLFNILLALTLSAAMLQDTNNVEFLFEDFNGTAKIDLLNNYAINFGKNTPELRLEIGQKCYSLSLNENYQFGLLQSLYNIGAGYFHQSHFDSALVYYKRGDKYAKKLKNLSWEMNFATNIGQVFSNNYQFDSANVYYAIGIENAKIIKDTLAVGYLYNSIGAAYWKKGEFSNAIKYYKLGLKIHKKKKNYRRLARSYNSIGSSYWNLNNNILALEYYLDALEVQKYFAKIKSSLTLNNVGLLYLELEDTTLAKKYFNEGLKSATEKNSTLGKGYSFLNFGDLNFKRKKYDKALQFYNKAIAFYEKLKDKNGIAQILNKIGEVYHKKGQYKLAKNNFLEAYRISKINRLKLTQTESLINFCKIQIYQGKSSKVRQNLDKAFQLAEEGNFAESKLKIFKLQSDVYENLKDYKTALFFHHQYDLLKDSLFSVNSIRILSDTKEKYEADKKEKINNNLQHINKIQVLELESQKKEKLYGFLISLFSFFIIIFLIYQNTQRKNRNTILQKAKDEVEIVNEKLNETNELLQHSNSTKDRFFSIISHDLKNPFNTLLGATQILQSDFNEMSLEDNKELIDIIYNDSQKLYSLLENLLYWANSQTGKLKANKTSILLHPTLYEIYNLYRSSAENKNVFIKIDVQKSLIVLFDEFMLSTIVRNLLSNAIKFTNNGGTILLTAFEKDGKIHLSVADEGVGIKKENISTIFDGSSNIKNLGTNKEKGTGLGLILCYDFAKENDAEIKVSSTVGKGTMFELIIDKEE